MLMLVFDLLSNVILDQEKFGFSVISVNPVCLCNVQRSSYEQMSQAESAELRDLCAWLVLPSSRHRENAAETPLDASFRLLSCTRCKTLFRLGSPRSEEEGVEGKGLWILSLSICSSSAQVLDGHQ